MRQVGVPGTGLASTTGMLKLVRSRLSVRLALLFLAASLAPVLGVGYLTLVQLERAVQREARQRQELLAAVVEDLLLDAADRAREKLITLGRLVSSELAAREVGAFDLHNDAYRDTVVERLSALIEPPGLFLELQYFASGKATGDEPRFVAQAQQLEVAQSQRRSPDFPAGNFLILEDNRAAPLVQEPVNLGTPYRERAFAVHEGFPTLRLSQPIPEPTGGTGALVAYVDFSELRRTLERLAGEDAAIRVTDASGTILTEVGSVQGERLTRARTVRDSSWRIEVAESYERVRAPLARMRWRILPWIGGAALFAVWASLFFSTRITRPLARLRRAAEALEAGDLEARAEVAREDEIGLLGAAFDRMASALHELDSAKSEFIGNVSHELRTPLTSLRLSVANLLDGVTGELPPAQRETLGRVRRELDHLSVLVDDLLELARLEAGVVTPAREQVDLAALARDCVEALAPAARAAGIELSVAGQGEAHADPEMLRRVLLNLLDNGVKFTPRGGGVWVRVGQNRLQVADDGPGGVASDAFERFRQGEVDGVKHPGAGLGLSIVARLVELCGGSVSVDSDNGSVFTVDLSPPGRAT